MTIDEAIEHAESKATCTADTECGNEHAQLARWLRELRARRENGDKQQKPAAWYFYQGGLWHLTDEKRDWYDAVNVEEIIPLYTAPPDLAAEIERLKAERDEWQCGEGIAIKLIGELELEVTALKEVSDHHLRDVTNLCGHIAASEQRIKELEVENLEQARLLSMSGEREADLRGEVERLRAALKKAREHLTISEWNPAVQAAVDTIDEALK